MVINQQSTGTVKHLESLIQLDNSAGVVAPIQKTRRLQVDVDCAFRTRQNTLAILPYRLERYGKQETRLDR